MKKLLSILGVFGIIIFMGGCSMNKQMQEDKQREEMLKVVRSEEVKQLIEEGIKNLDSQYLTETGIIKSYKIDYNSAELHPMGGIVITTYINNNKDLYIKDTINEDYASKKLEIGGSIVSKKLSDLLKGE
ncbi:DUF1310 family protein [Streptococcus sanguinis]|uniref:DUF1310 family protein n=1 Tax=Streptococcus sanguinis TaxID=1305 RepID=A0A7H8V9K4_STRSA|nr:DUF1310 family protein [Streptococcus sanguinis]